MKKTLICILTTLILLSSNLVLFPNASAETQNVKIVSTTYYVDSLGVLIAVGEIQNIGNTIIANVTLTGTAYSPDGTALRDSYVKVYGNNIVPQEKAPFLMQFAMPQNSIDGTWNYVSVGRVDIHIAEAPSTTSYQYPDLQITNLSSYIDSTPTQRGAYWVTGNVKNIGTKNAQNIVVYGTFYNSHGDVVGVGYTDSLTPYSLSPGDSASFKVAPFDLNQSAASTEKQVASYKMLIQVAAPIIQGTPPSLTPGPTAGNSATPLPSNGSSDSSSTDYTWLLYVAIVIIVVIAVIAAIRTFPKRKTAPIKTKAKSTPLSKTPLKKPQRR